MFEKNDAAWDELTVNREKRLAAIQQLTQKRVWLFWCVIVLTLTQVISIILSLYRSQSPGEWLNAFVVILTWSSFNSLCSELRLLRVVEQLHQQTLRPSEKEGPPRD